MNFTHYIRPPNMYVMRVRNVPRDGIVFFLMIDPTLDKEKLKS